MKYTIQIAGASLMTLALGGCFNGSGGSNDQSQQPAMSQDFGTFVKAEFDNPDPNRDATKINGIDFSFNDQDDPKAFDDLLR